MGDERQAWLVLLAQSGDRAAFGELVGLTAPGLLRFLGGLVGAQAEDLAQETFVVCYRKLRWLRQPEMFRGWVYRIAARAAFRALARQRRHSHVALEEAGELPAPEVPPVAEPRLLARLPALVEALSPASRAVVLLHYGEGLSLDEVAQALDIAVGTAKSRLHHGLTTLRRRLGELETTI